MAGMMTVAVIGAGAAGCFCAIELRRRHPDFDVTVFESGRKPLAKVAVTGGGRCNLTNSFALVDRLEDVYPRGFRVVSRAFRVFDNEDTVRWFENEGVRLVTQEDQCVFPKSQDAMEIVGTLERLMRETGVRLRLESRVEAIRSLDGGKFIVETAGGDSRTFDRVVVTTGGGALKQLEPLGIAIEKPVPSLFTLKLEDASLRSLMGTVVDNVILSLAGTKFRSEGILLLTDWGVSGPATLKLSSYAARHLAGNGYTGDLLVNWMASGEEEVRQWIRTTIGSSPRKLVMNVPHPSFTARLWRHLCLRAGIRDNQPWAELGTKGMNRLVSVLVSDSYKVTGRCHFKEEFVTCGGVSLSELNISTLESKRYPGLYFAGEVADIDAVTGGFNLQAAWSTAMVVAKSM